MGKRYIMDDGKRIMVGWWDNDTWQITMGKKSKSIDLMVLWCKENVIRKMDVSWGKDNVGWKDNNNEGWMMKMKALIIRKGWGMGNGIRTWDG